MSLSTRQGLLLTRANELIEFMSSVNFREP
jgi:hypothetical protein